MSNTMSAEHFKWALFKALEETFEQVHGIYLDKGTSLFETLDTVSAEVASRPVSADCATIAAQVEHVRFYLDVLEAGLSGSNPGRVDWGEIWRTVGAVTPEEWEASRARLKASYQRIRALLEGFAGWEDENNILDAMAVLVHTAYHLGEIRQALCTVR